MREGKCKFKANLIYEEKRGRMLFIGAPICRIRHLLDTEVSGQGPKMARGSKKNEDRYKIFFVFKKKQSFAKPNFSFAGCVCGLSPCRKTVGLLYESTANWPCTTYLCLFLWCASGGTNSSQLEMSFLNKIRMLDVSVQNILSEGFGCWLSEGICRKWSQALSFVK